MKINSFAPFFPVLWPHRCKKPFCKTLLSVEDLSTAAPSLVWVSLLLTLSRYSVAYTYTLIYRIIHNNTWYGRVYEWAFQCFLQCFQYFPIVIEHPVLDVTEFRNQLLVSVCWNSWCLFCFPNTIKFLFLKLSKISLIERPISQPTSTCSKLTTETLTIKTPEQHHRCLYC